MTQNSACIVEVTANDAEMEYGPKLKGAFYFQLKKPWIQTVPHAACNIACAFAAVPFASPLSIVWTTVGWLCFPIGHFVNDEEDPRSWRTTCANYLCCYANRWSLCASLYVFCPCFNMDPTEFVEAFGDGMRMEWLQGAQIHPLRSNSSQGNVDFHTHMRQFHAGWTKLLHARAKLELSYSGAPSDFVANNSLRHLCVCPAVLRMWCSLCVP